MPNPHVTIADDGSGQTVGVGASGALKVDPSAVTQPVSGAISIAAGSISIASGLISVAIMTSDGLVLRGDTGTLRVGVFTAPGAQGGAAVTTFGDGSGANTSALWVNAQLGAFNGAGYDRVRKDTYAAGPQWMALGGASTVLLPAVSVGTLTVVKNSAGRLAKAVLISAGNGASNMTVYDNASAQSGTPLYVLPNNTAVTGTPITIDMPAANGLTVGQISGGPAVTLSYY